MDHDLYWVIHQQCVRMEVPLVGIADVERWTDPPFQPWMPEEFFPQSIFPTARSVVVIGLPIHLPVLETSPSIYYREIYTTVNTLLDQYTYRLACFLNDLGYPSVFVPRDGYGSIKVLVKNPIAFFSHRHAAVLAGLGTFGVNNMVLTQRFGPRVRFGSVLTSAVVPPDPVKSVHLCTRCMQCVRNCPSKALSGEDYPSGLTDRFACASYSAVLNERFISPCGICIKVCPVGEDRQHFGREDLSVYRDNDPPSPIRNAWEHVRRYGGL